MGKPKAGGNAPPGCELVGNFLLFKHLGVF